MRLSNGPEHYWQESGILKPYFRTGCCYKLEWKCIFLSLSLSSTSTPIPVLMSTFSGNEPPSCFAFPLFTPRLNGNRISILPNTPQEKNNNNNAEYKIRGLWLNPLQEPWWTAGKSRLGQLIILTLCDAGYGEPFQQVSVTWRGKALRHWQVNSKAHNKSQTDPLGWTLLLVPGSSFFADGFSYKKRNSDLSTYWTAAWSLLCPAGDD